MSAMAVVFTLLWGACGTRMRVPSGLSPPVRLPRKHEFPKRLATSALGSHVDKEIAIPTTGSVAHNRHDKRGHADEAPRMRHEGYGTVGRATDLNAFSYRRTTEPTVSTGGARLGTSTEMRAASRAVGVKSTSSTARTAAVVGSFVLLTGVCGYVSRLPRAGSGCRRPGLMQPLRAQKAGDVNYFELLTKGDLPGRLLTIMGLLALARVGYYLPLYGFDADAVGEYFGRQASQGNLGFIDQLFGGGLGKVSLFSLGIGPYITSSIVFQIITQVTPSLKALAQGEEGEAGRDKYKNYIKYTSVAFGLVQGFGQAQILSPYVFDNGPLWAFQTSLQLAFGAFCQVLIADKITDQKLGQGASLLVFSSIVANLPRTVGITMSKAAEDASIGNAAVAIFGVSLLVTILGLVFVLQAERRIPIVFAKRLQEESTGQGPSDDVGGSFLPIKLNASGVLPIIFASSLLSLPALASNYTRQPWIEPIAKSLLPGSQAYIPLSMVLIGIFSYVSTFQVLDPKDMSKNLRKQAAAIPGVRPGRETEEYLRNVLTRASIFGAVILALLFVLPNLIEAATKLSTPNSFAGTSLLILVGVAADTWRQLQAELLMQQYATDVDRFYKGSRD